MNATQCARSLCCKVFTAERNSPVAVLILLGLVLPVAGQTTVPVDGQVFMTNAVLAPGIYFLPTGVSIGASGVTLNMNGASFVGSNFNNYGITSIGHDNVVIRNGTIRGYYYGVRIESGTNLQVCNNDLRSEE